MVTHVFIHIDLVFNCVDSTEKKMVASSQVKWVNTWWYIHLNVILVDLKFLILFLGKYV